MLGSPSAGRRLTCAGTGSRGGHIADTRGNTAKLCCTSCDTRVVTAICCYSDTFFVSDGRQKIVNEGSRIPGRLLLNKQVDGCPDIGFMILIDSSWPSLCSVWSSIFLAELWPPSWRCTGQWRACHQASCSGSRHWRSSIYIHTYM